MGHQATSDRRSHICREQGARRSVEQKVADQQRAGIAHTTARVQAFSRASSALRKGAAHVEHTAATSVLVDDVVVHHERAVQELEGHGDVPQRRRLGPPGGERSERADDELGSEALASGDRGPHLSSQRLTRFAGERESVDGGLQLLFDTAAVRVGQAAHRCSSWASAITNQGLNAHGVSCAAAWMRPGSAQTYSHTSFGSGLGSPTIVARKTGQISFSTMPLASSAR